MSSSKAIGHESVRLIWDILLFVVVAAGLGLGSAYIAIKNSDKLDLYQLGPWKAWPIATSPKADPYSRAQQVRQGALLLGAGEGLAFEATHDDDGTPLDGACQYRLDGSQFPARLWTLSLVNHEGKLVDNPSRRYGFSSQTIMRHSEADFTVFVGPQAMGGNWLQSPTGGTFRLILRLYETPLNSADSFSNIALPSIRWESCR